MAERNVDVKFRFLSDRTATNQLLRDQDKIEQGYDDMAAAAKQTARAQTDLEQSGRRVADAQQTAIQAQVKLARESGQAYGDVGRRTMAFGGLASGLGGTGIAGRLMIAADILDATEAAKAMRAEFPALIQQMGLTKGSLLALGAAGVAAAAAIVIIKTLLDDMSAGAQAAQQAVQGRIAALKEFYGFIGSATSNDLKARIDEVAERRKLNGMFLEDLYELKSAVEAGVDISDQGAVAQLSEGAVRAMDKLGIMGVGLKDLDKAIAEATVENTKYRSEFDLLTEAYTSGAAATNDARVREQEATARKIAGLEAEAAAQIQTAQQIESSTSKQIEDRLDAITTEKDIYQDLIAELEPLAATSDEAQAKLALVRDQMYLLGVEEQRLLQNVLPVLQASEREAALLKQMTGLFGQFVGAGQKAFDLMGDTGKKMGQGADILAKAEYDRSLIAKQTQADIKTVEQKGQTDRTTATREFEQSRAELEGEYQTERASIIQDHQDTLADITEKYQDEARKSEERYRREQQRATEDHQDKLLDAASRLDAPAVLSEQRQFTKDQRRKEEEFKDSQKERKREYQIQLRDEQKAFDDRMRQASQNYQRELQRLQQTYNARLQQLDAAQRAELSRIQQAGLQRQQAITTQAQRELTQLFGFQNTEYQTRQDHYDALIAQLNTWKQQATATLSGGAVGVTSGSSIMTTRRTRNIPEFQAGGYTSGGMIGTEPGEFMLARPTVRALERGFGGPLTQQRIQNISRSIGPVSIQMSFGDIGNKSIQQIEAMVDRKMRNFVEGMVG